MNNKIIAELRDQIYDVLSPIIRNNRVVLVDAPYYKNIGDVLIWEGELEFLENIGCNILGSYSRHTFQYPLLDDNVIILFSGGGNFGDIYPEHMSFLKKILSKYPNNKIIIFPQTIHYNDKENQISDLSILAKHKNLIVCARDTVSHQIISQHLKNEQCLCLPDMAFCMDINKYLTKNELNSDGILNIVRADCEKAITLTKPNTTNDPCSQDWPSFTTRFHPAYIINTIIDRTYRFLPLKKIIGPIWDNYALKRFRKNMINLGISFIKGYSVVISERLHGAILAILLNKEVTIVDNSYGKNSSFYYTWLKQANNIKLNTL